MKYKTVAVIFVALFAYINSNAQTNKPLEDFKPSSVNQQGKQFPQVNYESPETAHEWLTWRRDLNEFTQRLFK